MDDNATHAPPAGPALLVRYLTAMRLALEILARELNQLSIRGSGGDPLLLDHLRSLTIRVTSLEQEFNNAAKSMEAWPEPLMRQRADASVQLCRDLNAAADRTRGPVELGSIVDVYLTRSNHVWSNEPLARSPSSALRSRMLGRLAKGESAFYAHPRLAVDRILVAKKLFQIVVGFSESADVGADFTTPIEIANAKPGEVMDVLISISGATLRGTWKVTLPLDLRAEQTVPATVQIGATEVKLAASYLFRQRLVGTIGKTIAVGEAPQVAEPCGRSDAASWLPALGDASAIEAIDIFLIVQSQEPNLLEWKAYVAKSEQTMGPLTVAVHDTAAFAKKLAGIAAASAGQDDDGLLDVIDVGQSVASLIPSSIVDEVLTPALEANRTPTVLLFTDEPFVPWELARLSSAQAARPEAAFLGEIVSMGRWWLRATSTGPASTTLVQRISAVAASTYDDGANETLLHAITERKTLVSRYRADKVEARQAPVRKWLTGATSAGHLAHIALHGYSNPTSQEEGLILGDGTNLTPIRLSGEWNKGETPRFSIVFLNACQVGTAGRRLGQMSGFPGVLIRNGVSAFIAPLWEVDDAVASQVAEGFYMRALDKSIPVGEALRLMRARPRIKNSITPLAYVYYGHPALRILRKRAAA